MGNISDLTRANIWVLTPKVLWAISVAILIQWEIFTTLYLTIARATYGKETNSSYGEKISNFLNIFRWLIYN